jgi:hypothetical protein
VSGTEEGPTKGWQVRYKHAKARKEDVERLSRAFGVTRAPVD